MNVLYRGRSKEDLKKLATNRKSRKDYNLVDIFELSGTPNNLRSCIRRTKR